MKKILVILMICLSVFSVSVLVACGDEKEDTASQTSTQSSTSSTTSSSTTTKKTTTTVDIDLTKMSSTMVYSEVYEMVNNSRKYVGKKVKMNGLTSVYHSDSTDKTYYSVIIKDATACCSQGLEFELKNGISYPKSGDSVTVIGTFATYDETVNGETYTYCYLRNAQFA